MPKFLLVYRSAPMTEEPSPEVMQAVLAKWGEWIGQFMQSGNIVDPGDGLKPETKTLRGTVATDGPFAEAKEVVGGYSVIQADTWDQAVTIAKACPAASEGTIEIRELAGFA